METPQSHAKQRCPCARKSLQAERNVCGISYWSRLLVRIFILILVKVADLVFCFCMGYKHGFVLLSLSLVTTTDSFYIFVSAVTVTELGVSSSADPEKTSVCGQLGMQYPTLHVGGEAESERFHETLKKPMEKETPGATLAKQRKVTVPPHAQRWLLSWIGRLRGHDWSLRDCLREAKDMCPELFESLNEKSIYRWSKPKIPGARGLGRSPLLREATQEHQPTSLRKHTGMVRCVRDSET